MFQTAVEAMLRTGVQSQLEGIRTAIGHLSTTVEDIRGVETRWEIFVRLAVMYQSPVISTGFPPCF